MMNALELLAEPLSGNGAQTFKQRMAVQMPNGRSFNFAELVDGAVRAQNELQKLGVQNGDSVLVADTLHPELYSVVIAILGLGATVVLVEPFLPLHEINFTLNQVKPKVFVSGWLGKCWGLRSSAVRAIPHWRSTAALLQNNTNVHQLKIESVNPDHPAILTFTSGTSAGTSKGVVRSHSIIRSQTALIERSANLKSYEAPDLAVFANLVLANLAMGRGSVLVPASWKLSGVPLHGPTAPVTVSCGPGFLKHALKLQDQKKFGIDQLFENLKSIHVGGALSDNADFEKCFSVAKQAKVFHVYGSSEAEPIAFCDARLAVQQSKKNNYYQTVFLGSALAEVQSAFDPDTGLWVTGPHVCKLYMSNDAENKKSKRTDASHRVWHRMGDRVRAEADGWWFQGRAEQSLSEFGLEQNIYSYLQDSRSMVANLNGVCTVVGENINNRLHDLKLKFPQVDRWMESPMIRDRRHRARIDRKKTLQKFIKN
jgi:acyl-CoA synthetase (AMP-forming)/AMP-acid ligase II